MNLLIAEKGWGLLLDEQVMEIEPSIFPCGKCSFEEVKVYHNVLGQHVHLGKQVLTSMMEKQGLNE